MTNLVIDIASQIVNVGTDPRHRIEWRCDHCKALARTAHLAGLGWLHQTDWTALLQRCEIPTLRPSQAAHIEGQPAR